MRINQAEFILSAMGPSQYPNNDLPEIALVGRSNVGKSSTINRLLNRKNLARRSATPGKTQALNYFLINESLYFVDLPGYGYAKVSKTMRAQWGEMIEHYLVHRSELKLVLLVVDLRHQPTQDDITMYEWLQHFAIPCCVVATKSDKLPKSKWEKQRKMIKHGLQLKQEPLILFSAESGIGKEQLWEQIQRYLA